MYVLRARKHIDHKTDTRLINFEKENINIKGLQNFGETLMNQIVCRPTNVRYLLGGICMYEV